MADDATDEAVQLLTMTQLGQERSPSALAASRDALGELYAAEFDALPDDGGTTLASHLVSRLRPDDRARFAEPILEMAKAFYDEIIVVSPPSTQATQAIGDPVDAASGAFTEAVTDFVVGGGEGFDVPFTRTFRSDAIFTGPLGFGWDHSLNLWLRVAATGDVIFRSTGNLREDIYRRHEVHSYFVPPNGVHDTVHVAADSFSAVTPGGTTTTYERSANPLYHRAKRIEDRCGRFVAFSYDIDGRLDAAYINSAHRWIRFRYGGRGRIASISLHPAHARWEGRTGQLGRTWRYEVEAESDTLIAVVGPNTRGRFTTMYHYEEGSGRRRLPLLHGISQHGTRFALQLEYESWSARPRVSRQIDGHLETTFEYEAIEPDPSTARPDAARSMTRVISPSGHVLTSFFNDQGNALATIERVVTACKIQRIVTAFRYNLDGAVVASVSPEGRASQRLLGREHYYHKNSGANEEEPWTDPLLTPQARATFGNVLSEVRRMKRLVLRAWPVHAALDTGLGSALVAGSDDVVQKFTYEPRFQRLSTSSDSRYTVSPDPAGGEPASYYAALTRSHYSASPPYHLERIEYPSTSYPAPLPHGAVRRPGSSEHFEAYDSRGRLTRHRDAEGVVRHSRYFSDTDARSGFLRSVTVDPDGLALTTRFRRDEMGSIIESTDPLGGSSKTLRDEYARAVRIKNAATGQTTELSYDARGEVTDERVDCLSPSGLPHPDGQRATTKRFGVRGEPVQEARFATLRPELRVATKYVYDGAGRRIKTVTPRGMIERRRYDERGRVTVLTRACCTPEESSRRFKYDHDGLCVAQWDGEGRKSASFYDSFGRLVLLRDALGAEQHLRYDKRGNIVQRWFVALNNGLRSLIDCARCRYDERGRCIADERAVFDAPLPIADPQYVFDREVANEEAAGRLSWASTLWFLDNLGRTFRARDAALASELSYFDTAGRQVGRIDRTGAIHLLQLDALGNVVQAERLERRTLGALQYESFVAASEFDKASRLTVHTNALGAQRIYNYDSWGRLVRTVDELGNVWTRQHDLLGLETIDLWQHTADGTGRTAPTGIVRVIRRFDEGGNLVAYVDPRGTSGTTRYEYDLLDRVRRSVSPLGRVWTRVYDRADNPISDVTAAGFRISRAFDAMNRLVREEYSGPAGGAVGETFAAFGYDARGRYLRLENDWRTVTIERNSNGLPLREVVHDSGVPGAVSIRREYDLAGRRVVLQSSDGSRFRYRYDRAGRLRRIVREPRLGAPAVSVAQMWYVGARCWRYRYPAGVVDTRAFDGAGRCIGSTLSGGQWRVERAWLFDAVGNLRALRVDVDGVVREAVRADYDSLYQLVEVSAAQPPIVLPPGIAPPSPGGTRPTQTVIDAALGSLGLPGPRTWIFDSSGNRRQERGVTTTTYVSNRENEYVSVGGGGWAHDSNGNTTTAGPLRFRYGPHNRLARAISPIATLDLRYDALGRLCTSNDGTGWRRYRYEDDSVLEEEAVGGLTNVHIPGPRWAMSVVSATLAGQTLTAVVRDIIGSPVALVNENGSLLWHGSWSPFGLAAQGMPAWCRQGFAGYWRLHHAGLLLGRWRVMNPSAGRFLQSDPAGFVDGPNTHSYAANNPLRFVDPAGLSYRDVNEQAAERAPIWSAECWRLVGRGLNYYYEGEDQNYTGYNVRVGRRMVARYELDKQMRQEVGAVAWTLATLNDPHLEDAFIGPEPSDPVGQVVANAALTLFFGAVSLASRLSLGRLNIGAGRSPMPGAVNIDIDPRAAGVIRGDVNALEFPSGSVNEVHAINPQYLPVGAEVGRVLAAGGKVFVTGTPRNAFIRATGQLTDAYRSGLVLRGKGPMIPSHAALDHMTTSGKMMKTWSSTTRVWQKVPAPSLGPFLLSVPLLDGEVSGDDAP